MLLGPTRVVLEAPGSESTNVVGTAASVSLLLLNNERRLLEIYADPAGTGNAYLFLGATAVSATNFHIALSPGQSVDLSWYRGPIQMLAPATLRLGVIAG